MFKLPAVFQRACIFTQGMDATRKSIIAAFPRDAQGLQEQVEVLQLDREDAFDLADNLTCPSPAFLFKYEIGLYFLGRAYLSRDRGAVSEPLLAQPLLTHPALLDCWVSGLSDQNLPVPIPPQHAGLTGTRSRDLGDLAMGSGSPHHAECLATRPQNPYRARALLCGQRC